MTIIDLEREFLDAQTALSIFERTILKSLGLDPRACDGLIGAAQIRLHGELWEPGDESRAFITPVRIDGPWPEAVGENLELVVPYGDLCDLIAWHPDSPNRWALRCGCASWLGVTPPFDWIVRRTVLSWLKAGASGIVALGHTWQERQALLRQARTLYAEDLDHAIELRQLLERPSLVPHIKVGEPRDVSTAGAVEA